MIRKDYILRLVEMFAEALATMLGIIKKKDFATASKTIENAYIDFLQKEAAFFYVIPEEHLTTELIEKHNYTNHHLEILAGLFYAETELILAQGRKNECIPFAEKALRLYEFVDSELKTYQASRVEIMNKLKQILLSVKN